MQQQIETQTPPLITSREDIETRPYEEEEEPEDEQHQPNVQDLDNGSVDSKQQIRTNFEIQSASATDEEQPIASYKQDSSNNNDHNNNNNDVNMQSPRNAGKQKSPQKINSNVHFNQDSEMSAKPNDNPNIKHHDGLQMSFQLPQQYDNLAMTQQREKLPSSQLDRKPIDVSAQNKAFRISIAQGSADSHENASTYRMAKKPTLGKESGRGFSQKDQGNYVVKTTIHDQSMLSTQRSFEVNPRYNSRQPHVTIQSSGQILNADLHIGAAGSQTTELKSFLKSPSRKKIADKKKAELYTNTVRVDETELSQGANLKHQISSEALSPTLRGSKLKLNQHQNLAALKGMDSGSPRYLKAAQIHHQIVQQNQPTLQTYTPQKPKKAAQIHQKQFRTEKAQLIQQQNPQHKQQQQSPLSMMDNVLSGSQINIQQTPAIQFIQERKQQLAKRAVGLHNTSMLNDTSLINANMLQTATLMGQIIQEEPSRGISELDEYTKDNLTGNPQYYQYKIKGNGSSPSSKYNRPNNTTNSPLNSSKHSKGGFASKRNMNLGSLSKDLISVINDMESQESFKQPKQHQRLNVTNSQAQVNHQPPTQEDNQRGSAITFFDESDNEDKNNKIDDELNATLPALKSEINGDNQVNIATKSPQDTSQTRDHSRQRNNASPTSSTSKNITAMSGSASNQQQQPLGNLKQNLLEFHNNHAMKVKASEAQLMNLFPDLAQQIEVPNQQMYTSNIPRIDMTLNEKQIFANKPASGIRIFEEHQNETKLNKTSAKLSQSITNNQSMQNSPTHSQNSGSNFLVSRDEHKYPDGALYAQQVQQPNFQPGSQNYQLAPHQKSNQFIGDGDTQYGTPLPLAMMTGQGVMASDASLNNGKKPNFQLQMNEHKRIMQTFSPNMVMPDLYPTLKFDNTQNSSIQQLNLSPSRHNGLQKDNASKNMAALKGNKMTLQVEQGKQLIKNSQFSNTGQQVHLDLTQKFSKNQKRLIERKNTEVLANGSFSVSSPSRIQNNNNTIQKVIDMQEKLNITIQEHDAPSYKDQSAASRASILDQMHNLEQDQLRVQKGVTNLNLGGQNNDAAFQFAVLEDAITLEQKESAMARYMDMQNGPDLRITTTSKNNAFNLTNNMMSLRQMQPKETSIYPMETPPPVMNTQRLNVTQFRKQMQMIDTNAKFNMSFLASPRQNPPLTLDKIAQQHHQKTFMQSPTTDMRIMINHRQQQSTGMAPPMPNGAQGVPKMTIADRIKEVKEKSKYGGTPSLTQQVTQSHFSQRSRSIDVRTKKNLNPFSVGGLHQFNTSPRGIAASTLISDVAKRFKNISDREAPANHISDKVYAAAQNNSMYTNAYSYVKKNADEPKQKRAQMSQSVNQSPRSSKSNLKKEGMDIVISSKKNQYQQRKLSVLERPTQLEIGGEGSPMLSLLPPLRTREISPKFAYTVGAKVRDQQTCMANLKSSQDRDLNGSGRQLSLNKKGKHANKNVQQIHFVPNTKIIISQSGDSPTINKYTDDGGTNIKNHPVMIKAVSSNKSLLNQRHSKQQERENQLQHTEHLGEVLEAIENAHQAQDIDLRLESAQAEFIQNEYRDVFLVKDDGQDYYPMGALHLNPMDASLNEKLYEMASKVHQDVVVPQQMTGTNDPVQYERRRLNIDGSWKENRYNKNGQQSPGGTFHFLEYASKNFKNPLDLIQANSSQNQGVSTVAQTQQLNFDAFEAIATKKRLQNQKSFQNRSKSRTKRGNQGQYVDEKFSLKVQKKPINGLQHIKVQQAIPGGAKLYSIQVKQKSPVRFLSNTRIKDSIEAAPSRKDLNETRRWQETTFHGELQSPTSPTSPDLPSRVNMVARNGIMKQKSNLKNQTLSDMQQHTYRDDDSKLHQSTMQTQLLTHELKNMKLD